MLHCISSQTRLFIRQDTNIFRNESEKRVTLSLDKRSLQTTAVGITQKNSGTDVEGKYCNHCLPNMDDSVKSNEINIEDLVKKYSWMVRPCVLYKEEYSDCTSIKSRFHQKFVTGSFEDCSQWKYDYDSCLKWREDNDPKAFRTLIESELKKRQARLGAHLANDIWEKREKPPEDWNAPLPAWMEERIKASYLAIKAEELKEGKPKKDSLCVIS